MSDGRYDYLGHALPTWRDVVVGTWWRRRRVENSQPKQIAELTGNPSCTSECRVVWVTGGKSPTVQSLLNSYVKADEPAIAKPNGERKPRPLPDSDFELVIKRTVRQAVRQELDRAFEAYGLIPVKKGANPAKKAANPSKAKAAPKRPIRVKRARKT